MRASINTLPPDDDFIDEDSTDHVGFDKKQWRTMMLVLMLLAATIVMIFALA